MREDWRAVIGWVKRLPSRRRTAAIAIFVRDALAKP